MNKRSLLIVALTVGIAVLFATAGIYAGTEVEDVIKMETKEYEKHKKGIVEFTHKKHIEKYKLGCGECHHADKDGDGKAEPLNDLKAGDEVQRCIACHKKPDEIKGKKAKKLSDAQQREYHANALHDNCKGCHKDYNKKNKTKAAPTTCGKCHPKKKK